MGCPSFLRHLAAFAVLFGLGFGGAQAGSISPTAWMPSAACGARPQAVPTPDPHSADTYNASVRKINDFRQQLRDHVDCVVKEANADIQLVSKSAQALQQSARETDEQLQLDVKAAREKLN